MPKKFQGENSKAATAKARKAEAKAVADARKKQQEEDALWEETDKHVLKKGQRKVSYVTKIVSLSHFFWRCFFFFRNLILYVSPLGIYFGYFLDLNL